MHIHKYLCRYININRQKIKVVRDKYMTGSDPRPKRKTTGVAGFPSGCPRVVKVEPKRKTALELPPDGLHGDRPRARLKTDREWERHALLELSTA